VLRRVLGSVFSFDRVPSWASGSLGYNLRFRSGLFVLSRSGLLRSVLRRVLDSDRVVASIFFLRSVSRVFLLSATVFVLRRCSWIGRCLRSFGVFDPSPSPSGLRYLVFVSLVSSTAWCFVGFRSGIRSVLRSLWCFLEGASRWCSYGIVLRRLSGSASVVPLPFPVPFLGRSVCSQNLRRRTFRRSDRGVPDRGFSFSCVSSSEARTFETQ